MATYPLSDHPTPLLPLPAQEQILARLLAEQQVPDDDGTAFLPGTHPDEVRTTLPKYKPNDAPRSGSSTCAQM